MNNETRSLLSQIFAPFGDVGPGFDGPKIIEDQQLANQLIAKGVIERAGGPRWSPFRRYRLTAKGKDLVLSHLANLVLSHLAKDTKDV